MIYLQLNQSALTAGETSIKVSISFFIIYSLIISVSSVNNCPSIGILAFTDGVDWTRDATKTVADAANDSYCWLKNGGYMVCDGKWFETISGYLCAIERFVICLVY
jgi:hypothetical protein